MPDPLIMSSTQRKDVVGTLSPCRLRFAAKSEAYSPEQRSLLEEAMDTDTAAIELELEKLNSKPADTGDKHQPAALSQSLSSSASQRFSDEAALNACGWFSS